jgi:hypothetical protein
MAALECQVNTAFDLGSDGLGREMIDASDPVESRWEEALCGME